MAFGPSFPRKPVIAHAVTLQDRAVAAHHDIAVAISHAAILVEPQLFRIYRDRLALRAFSRYR